MTNILRGTLLSFDPATWTAAVLLGGSDAETVMPVGEWVPAGLLDAADEVAVLIFGGTNNDDGLILGPYGSVSTYNYPELSGLTAGQVLRATGATAAAFGALDLADADAVTGILPLGNGGTGEAGAEGTWTPTFLGTGTAGGFTYTNQVGYYIRLGGLVYITARLSISAIGTPPTGNMRIGGLPITSHASYNNSVAFGRISQFNYTAAAMELTGIILSGGTVIQLEEAFDNAGTVPAPAANFTNVNCDLIFSAVYLV